MQKEQNERILVMFQYKEIHWTIFYEMIERILQRLKTIHITLDRIIEN